MYCGKSGARLRGKMQNEDLERAEVGSTSGAATEGLSVQTPEQQKQIKALPADLQTVNA
jgi:hypothetical protein